MSPVARMTFAMLSRWRSGDDVLEPERLPGRDHEREHHREAAEDRAGDEVGREDRRVPARQLRDGEVEGHDGVDRDDERRREPGEEQVADPPVLPVARRAAPAERHDPVDDPAGPVLRRVAQRREVRDEPQVPEEERDRGVGRDREHVPGERALEVRPELGRRRVRDEPPEEPRPAEVDDRVHARHRHREERHRLGEAVDGGAPLLLEEEEDRADERAGVADADPPDEVRDVERPGDRDVVAPRADADEERLVRGESSQNPIPPRSDEQEQRPAPCASARAPAAAGSP